MLVTLPKRRVPGRIAARQADPRILAQLLHAERDAVLFLVELEDLRRDFVADREHFRRVLDAAPREVGDVQQAVDAAQVDERAVIGDVLDDALDGRAFLTASTAASRAPRPGSLRARRARETTTLLRLRSSLMTLNSSALFSYGVVSLTGRMSTSEPGRNARMPLTITVRPPLTLPVTRPETIVPCSIAASRSCHALRRLALSRESLVSP